MTTTRPAFFGVMDACFLRLTLKEPLPIKWKTNASAVPPCPPALRPRPPTPPGPAAPATDDADAAAKRDEWSVVGDGDGASGAAALTSLRQHTLTLLNEHSRTFTVDRWQRAVLPLVLGRYVPLLDHFKDTDGGRDAVWWYWGPSCATVMTHSAVADVCFEKANVLFNLATCELRAADALARGVSAVWASGSPPDAKTAMGADDDIRKAYRLLCSAATHFADGRAAAAEVERKQSFDAGHRDVVADSTSHFFAAMAALCLAQAQEIGFHRALTSGAATGDDSTSVARAQPTDGLRARLAARCHELFTEAKEHLTKVPHKANAAQAASGAGQGVPALRQWCAVQAPLWAAVAHALAARPKLSEPCDGGSGAAGAPDGPTMAMQHVASARKELAAAVAAAEDPVFATAGGGAALSALFHTPQRCIQHVAAAGGYVTHLCDAMARINELVHRVKPAAAEHGRPLPPAQELAKPKALEPLAPGPPVPAAPAPAA